MDMFKMEEFMDLGDVWGEDQTFDVNHFDDLDVTEAKNGLYDTSVKPKPQADTQVDLLQSLIDTPVGGYLGLEWMEQSNLMNYLQVPVEDGFITTEPVSGLLDDNLPLDIQNLALEEKSEPHGSSVAFLQSLLEEQEKLMALPLVKTEPTEPSVRIESEFPHVTVKSPASSAPSSPEAQVSPEIDFSLTGSFDLENVLIGGKVEFVQAPLSPDDVESLLSSASQSPSSSTVDTSSLYSDDNSLICNTSDLYEIVSNEKKKSRAAPYSKRSTPKNKGRKQTASISPNPSELELELMSKKDRKKLQNKNAAIRYRMKKKEESNVKKTEEEELEGINQSLQEKVDELNREIKYMKGLITDVRKARGLPPLVC